MDEKKRFASKDTEHSLSAVSDSSKKGFWSVVAVMVGFTFFSPSMNVGGNLGIGLNLRDFFLAIILGSAFLGAYTGVLAYIGQKTSLTFDLISRRSFGLKGSYLCSALISFTQIGWFGVGVAMFALALSTVADINTTLVIIVTGALMTLTAYYGIKALALLGTIAVPLIFLLGTYSVQYGIGKVGGFSNVFKENPENPITFVVALTLVIGSFISGGTSTPNFTRFAKTSKTAVVATVIAFFAGNCIMYIFGAVGGAVTGKADIFDILIEQGLMIPAILVLGLNIWTTNNNALYTAGLGLANITKIPNKPLVLIGGAIGTAGALWLYNNFVTYLLFLGGLIPPVGIVVILHYFMHRSDYNPENNVPLIAFNVASVLAVVSGALVGVFVDFGIKPVNALLVAGIAFIIFDKVLNKEVKNVN